MWIDAHNHLQRFAEREDWPEIVRNCRESGIEWAVVNGTSEADWEAVADLAREHSWIIPSFGIHPWYAPRRSALWQGKLLALLEEFPNAGVGEIGLDRWMENPDVEDQRALFCEQMQIATEKNRAATVHCVRAWGALEECDFAVPEPGFLLHAYGGPKEMVAGFAQRGARFSFNGYFLDPKRSKKLETFREIPRDRLLVETDAPDLLLPEELDRQGLVGENGERVNHPANLPVAYREFAALVGEELEGFAGRVRENFGRMFGV